MTADTILVRDGELAFVLLQDALVLLSVQRGAYFSLNKVGSQIWNMLIRPRRVGEIFDAMAEIHDVDRDVVTKDVFNFLDALLERHLVRVVNPDMIA